MSRSLSVANRSEGRHPQTISELIIVSHLALGDIKLIEKYWLILFL